MRIVQEMYARGFEFVPIDLYTAKAQRFQMRGWETDAVTCNY